MVDPALENITVRLSGIVSESVVDGVGFRMTVFTQGCIHNCKGCQNPQTHPLDGGEVTDLKYILEEVEKDPLLDGVTLSGGEPFLQAKPLAELSRQLHDRGLDVWCYSGFTYEELQEKAELDENIKALLNEVDVLVDGRFVLEKLDLKLKFRGSTNQRILDMKKTRKFGEPYWLDGMRD